MSRCTYHDRDDSEPSCLKAKLTQCRVVAAELYEPSCSKGDRVVRRTYLSYHIITQYWVSTCSLQYSLCAVLVLCSIAYVRQTTLKVKHVPARKVAFEFSRSTRPCQDVCDAAWVILHSMHFSRCVKLWMSEWYCHYCAWALIGTFEISLGLTLLI